MNKYFVFNIICLEFLLGAIVFIPVFQMCAHPAAWPDQSSTALLIFSVMADDPRICFQVAVNAAGWGMIISFIFMIIPAGLLTPLTRKIARLVKP